MAAIPCATYQAVNINSKLRRRHKSDSDATPPLSQPFIPLAGLDSSGSSASNSPAVPSSPSAASHGSSFFTPLFSLSQKMKGLTSSLTHGINRHDATGHGHNTTNGTPPGSQTSLPGSTVVRKPEDKNTMATRAVY